MWRFLTMKLFQASLYLEVLTRYHDLFPDERLNVLLSLAYNEGEREGFLFTYRDMLGELIFDSGAWSVAQGTSSFTLTQVITFLSRYKDKCNYYFSFDNDFSDRGFANNIANQVKMERAGLHPVPVIHNFCTAEIEHYVKSGKYTRLALGSSQSTNFDDIRYQHTTFDDEGNRVTQIRTMEGPTSLITTTVRGRLESQLEDRLITVHPNTTNDQTKEILGQLARKATGADSTPDDSEITAWQLFHESLEVLDVVIPFATGISDFVVTNGELPTSSRRAFKRVLSLIKTTALTYQHQRQRDDLGRVIAEVQDYAMAYQLIDESFRESVRKEKKYYDRRMRILEEKGPITMKDLARIEMVSVPALTQWLEQRLEKGLVTWCDDKGRKFIDERSLEKAKHSGKAFLKVTNPCRLPTPFELTGDDSWKQGQALYQMFDLGLENHEPKLSAIDSELAPGVETQVVCEEKPDGEGVKDLRGEKGEPMNFSNPVFDTHYQKIMDSKAKIDRVLRELEAIPSNYTNERKEEQMPC
jgi:hypothetical protein